MAEKIAIWLAGNLMGAFLVLLCQNRPGPPAGPLEWMILSISFTAVGLIGYRLLLHKLEEEKQTRRR